MGCVMCPAGNCSPDCIYLRVLPADPSVLEESRKKAIKIHFLSNSEYFEKCYGDAYSKGGVDAAKALVDSWILEYDARDKNSTLGLVGILAENESKIKSLEKQLEMYENSYGPLEDVAPAVVMGLSKCTTSLAGTSLVD